MTDVKLEDAERVALYLDSMAKSFRDNAAALHQRTNEKYKVIMAADDRNCTEAAALLRKIPELNDERLLLGRMLDLQTKKTSELQQKLAAAEAELSQLQDSIP